MAQNNAQESQVGGPLTGNIVEVSPWCEFSHEGALVAVGIEPSFASIRCVLAAYNVIRGAKRLKYPPA